MPVPMQCGMHPVKRLEYSVQPVAIGVCGRTPPLNLWLSCFAREPEMKDFGFISDGHWGSNNSICALHQMILNFHFRCSVATVICPYLDNLHGNSQWAVDVFLSMDVMNDTGKAHRSSQKPIRTCCNEFTLEAN